MRKKVMAANWKMYKTPDDTRAFFRDFLPLVARHDRDEIVICPPYTDVDAAIASARQIFTELPPPRDADAKIA